MRLWQYLRLLQLFGAGTIDWSGILYRTPSARRDQKATIV